MHVDGFSTVSKLVIDLFVLAIHGDHENMHNYYDELLL